jgi:hypothetical protein
VSIYRQWQQLLESEFLSSADAPVVLFIDDDELHRLRPDADDPASELAAAVRELVEPARGIAMFESAAAEFRRWRSSTQAEPPPVLPLLGLTVLAATRMRRDGAVSKSNYYLRLAEALVLDNDRTQIISTRDSLRGSGAFLVITDMWSALDRWITAHERTTGASTIHSHPRLKHIGYPLSQAVMRASDRAVLTRFFAALDVQGLGSPGEDALFSYLVHWSDRPRGFSGSFRAALADKNLAPLLSSIVHRLATAWDGQVRTDKGLRRLDLVLSLDIDEWRTRWLVASDSGPDHLVLEAPGGTSFELEREPESPFYAGPAPPVDGTAVRNGLRLTGGDYTAEFTGRRVVAFRGHSYTGDWVSCEGFTPFDEHLVAVAEDVSAGVHRALEQATGTWVEALPSSLLEGFTLIEDVRFDDPNRLRSALRDFPLLGRLHLTPERAARPHLLRGLPLSRQVSRSCYLRGGEPDLVLPSASEQRKTAIELDGESTEFLASRFAIELRRIGPLAVGQHEVIADGDRLEFRILDAEPEPGARPGTGAHAWTASGTLTESGPDSVVCGALVEPADATVPLLARRGKDETVVLYEGGRVQQVREPAYPAFLEGGPEVVRPLYFEVHAGPGVQWLAQRRQDRWTLTSATAASYVDVDVPELWRQVCALDCGPALWDWFLDSLQEDAW